MITLNHSPEGGKPRDHLLLQNNTAVVVVFCLSYRESFIVSIGLDDVSCAGQEVSSGNSPRAEKSSVSHTLRGGIACKWSGYNMLFRIEVLLSDECSEVALIRVNYTDVFSIGDHMEMNECDLSYSVCSVISRNSHRKFERFGRVHLRGTCFRQCPR